MISTMTPGNGARRAPASGRPQAIVIGAGLAGLACAADLAAAGLAVAVVEAADAPGGRMRTDQQAGFLLDRGFQVVNTSYPQMRRRIDLRALRLRPFTPGMLLHTGQGRLRFTDPTRRAGQAGQAADLLPGRLAGPCDLAALGILSARDMLLPARLIRRGRDEATLDALARAGISGELIERLFRPFLAGVFLEDELATSSRFFHLVWRSMLRGSLCLPRHGVQAVPAQLAAGLPPGTIRLETPVSSLTGDGVALADGTELAAPVVVVATGPTLLVDAERTILHTAVLTEVMPAYSGDGRALVCATVLGGTASGQDAAVRTRLAELYETDTGGWELLRAVQVDGALPAMLPPHPLSRACRIRPGRYVCGDHRATGSVQGALASGARAAREILARRDQDR